MVSVSKIKYIQLGELRLQIRAKLVKEANEVEVIVGEFCGKTFNYKVCKDDLRVAALILRKSDLF